MNCSHCGPLPTCNCGTCLQITIRLVFSILDEMSNHSLLQLNNFVPCLLFHSFVRQFRVRRQQTDSN